MRGEPEVGISFQRGMSLKPKCRMLRMNDNPHEELGAADAGRDEGVCDDQSPGRLVAPGASAGLRTDRAGVARPAVSPVEQGAKRHCEEFPRQSDRSQPRADDSPDPALGRDAADRAEAGPASELSTAIH